MNVQALIESFMHLAYPPLCLHCHDAVNGHGLFCGPCSTLLDLVDSTTRCKGCFSDRVTTFLPLCIECQRNPPLFVAAAAVFDHQGPAATLIKKMKYSDYPHLAQGIAAFMVAQWIRLKWPTPDLIVPVPMSRLKKWARGYNQSELIAEALGIMLDRPVTKVLQRRSGDYSQAGLKLEQRRGLKGARISLKEESEVKDRSILLIDDVMTSGSTLRRCAEALAEGGPREVYALTACRALR